MADERAIARYRRWYRMLLRWYSRPYRERFGESMEQTFNDLCRERAEAGQGMFGFVLWVFVETFVGIIRDNMTSIAMQRITRRLAVWAVVVGLLLLVPVVGMQLSEEWNWSPFDFVFAGIVLFGSALVYELVAAKGGTTAYRAAVGVACATALVLMWINAAVGIIGDGPVNLMYFGVIGVGMVGAFLARLEPRGMAGTLLAMAIAQMLVPVFALAWVPEADFAPGVVPVFCLNAVFAAFWIVSALLFRRAAVDPWTALYGR